MLVLLLYLQLPDDHCFIHNWYVWFKALHRPAAVGLKSLPEMLKPFFFSPTVTSPTPTRSQWPTAKWPQWMERAPGPSTQQAGAEPARAAIVSFVCVCVTERVGACLSIAGVKLNHRGCEHRSIINERETIQLQPAKGLLVQYWALLTLEETLSSLLTWLFILTAVTNPLINTSPLPSSWKLRANKLIVVLIVFLQ